MIALVELVHYITIALVVSISSIAVGISEGLASAAAIDAIDMQPKARSEIANTAILGMALIETAAIMGITIAMILLFGFQEQIKTFYFSIAEIGIIFAICISGFTIGLVSCWPVKKACAAIARQPFHAKKILRFMLITQTIIQTPIIFCFIIAMFIKAQAPLVTTLADGMRLAASGLCIGLGSVGPAIGLAHFAQSACQAIGVNPKSYNKILSFTFLSEAIIETPIIFSLVVSLLLMIISVKNTNPSEGVALLAAGLCMGIGTFAPGISSGRTAAQACKQIALSPENSSTLTKVSIFCQGMIDTCAIYTLIISLALIFIR